MIVTVTLNPAVDRTYFIGEFGWGRTIRATNNALGMGGKPTDASWILGELGYKSLALGFEAGDTGRLMEQMLQQRGCRTDFVRIPGDTRTNIVVISVRGEGQSTLASAGLEVPAPALEKLKKKFEAALRKASCVLIGGSLPPGVDASIYTELVSRARSAGVPVVFDASGPGLKAGMEGRPTMAKPNIDELSELVGRPIRDTGDAYAAGREVQAGFGTDLVITLGGQGALALKGEKAYRIPVLDIQAVSTAGAGDAVLAGLCAAYSAGKPVEEGLKLGFAAAAAVCLTPATADCRRADVERLLPQVRLVDYPG
jgi:1-phosphofructokinase family hexose kinase